MQFFISQQFAPHVSKYLKTFITHCMLQIAQMILCAKLRRGQSARFRWRFAGAFLQGHRQILGIFFRSRNAFQPARPMGSKGYGSQRAVSRPRVEKERPRFRNWRIVETGLDLIDVNRCRDDATTPPNTKKKC